MKKCSKCSQRKALAAFNRKGQGFQPHCRECQKAYYQAHYASRREDYYRRNAKTKTRITSAIKALKAKPCVDCGASYPYYVMHFDHLDGNQKDFNLSAASNYGSMRRALAEAEKCELVCANCHAERTHQRRCATMPA